MADQPPQEPPKGTTTEVKTTPKPKRVYTNPALRAMGIKQVLIPSRNWLIFWAVVGTIGGAIYYDKREQKQIRTRVCDELRPLSEVTYHTLDLPRKLTIYIAPPPNDFLDESVKMFRKYVKPYLNAAAIDFEIFSETRQGDIRAEVAQKIRDMRRAELERNQPVVAAAGPSWTQRVSSQWGKLKLVFSKPKQDDDEATTLRYDLYEAKDVLGLYKVAQPVKPVSEDMRDPVHAGGVLCIGRGAYKEYLNGVHEGLLGPLDKPQWLVEQEAQEAADRKAARLAEQGKDKKPELPEQPEQPKEELPVSVYSPVQVAAKAEEAPQEEEEEDLVDGRKPVQKAFIKPEDYANAPLAPELNMSAMVADANGVPVLFEQPVYVIPVSNLHGFTNMPRNIYRWFTKRFQAADLADRTLVVVNNQPRPFAFRDTLAAGEEELDWPKLWVERGRGKGSEWVQDLVTDERVTGRMRAYDNSKEL